VPRSPINNSDGDASDGWDEGAEEKVASAGEIGGTTVDGRSAGVAA
jgi:hypothetical protein